MRKGWSFGVAALLAACAGEPETGQRTQAVGPVSQGEAEPNAAFDSATPLALDASGAARVVGNVFGSGDVDVYSFAASAGDRFSAATMTAGNASGSVDSRLELLDSDGVTVLELDNDDGTFGTTASVIAGRFLPADGTYYVRVTHPLVTGQLRPYHLWARLQTDDPLPELEPNDAEPGQLLAPGSWVFGALASAADVDVYAVELQAGDSLFADLDLDPERDTIEWNGLLRLTAPGEPAMQANDNGAAAPDAEALFFTATAAGTYYLTVASSASAGTYGLSATVVPRADDGGCTTYSAADLPLAIPTDPGVVSSTLTIPDDVVIDDLEVQLTLDHTFIADLDITLTSPTGNTVALFTDVGTSTVGLGSRTLDITLADEAAMPISTAGITPILRGVSYMPELASRLEWFDGQPAAGTWTLTVYDDASGDGGSVTAWGLRVCPRGAVACPAGASEQALLTADFEADDGGFTHSGTADEWERGTPSLAPLTTCGGGAGCWATDLDGTYDVSSSQDLLSPTIDLSGVSGAVYARWKQAFQLEAAQFDRASVSIASAAAPATARTLWDHLGADMIITAGNPSTTLQSLAGWGTYVRDVSSFAGVADAQLRFHLDSDTTVQRRGMGIDDVDVFTCAFRCGDGVLYDAGLGGTEVCDDGNPTDGDGCDSNCTITACGNGVLTDGEACDDGNPTDGDGCDSNCTITACGNGVLTDGETCDDGNSTDGDGCDSNCTATACGNGVLTDGETCDDGNSTDGDGCDSNCTATACGNGVLTDGETCDDGNSTDGDGCDSNCTATACGNGVLTDGETCDDSNTADGDGCESDCTVTPDPACGDGTLDAGEACDDGNTADGDGCESDCTVTPTTGTCGDGTLDAGEACDDGNTEDGDGCDAQCDLEATAGGGGGCCQTDQTSGSGTALVTLLVGAVVARRRRRQARA